MVWWSFPIAGNLGTPTLLLRAALSLGAPGAMESKQRRGNQWPDRDILDQLEIFEGFPLKPVMSSLSPLS